MQNALRFDFTDHPLAPGYMVVLNGRPIGDCFATVREVLAFARSLGTPARYAGRCLDRVIAQGGRLQGDDENFID